MYEELVGKVSEFFARPVVAGVDVMGTLKVGDRVHIKGHTTDLETTITSMQIDHKVIDQANPGDSIGLKVVERVRRGDKVYKIIS